MMLKGISHVLAGLGAEPVEVQVLLAYVAHPNCQILTAAICCITQKCQVFIY